MSFAELLTPLKGRKSAMPRSAVHRNARLRPKPSRLVPTTWPCPLTALAWLTAPPSVPRSWIETSVDRKSTRLNSSHSQISYAVFCLKKKKSRQHVRSQLYHRCPLDE